MLVTIVPDDSSFFGLNYSLQIRISSKFSNPSPKNIYIYPGTQKGSVNKETPRKNRQ